MACVLLLIHPLITVEVHMYSKIYKMERILMLGVDLKSAPIKKLKCRTSFNK